MPESYISGEKVVIEAHQTNGDVTVALAYTTGEVVISASTDVLEAEKHDAKRKLRKVGKESVDLSFEELVTTTLPDLALMNLATGTAPQTIKFSGDNLYKVVVKVFAKAADANPDQTWTLLDVTPILDSVNIPPGSDYARAQIHFLVHGDVQLS